MGRGCQCGYWVAETRVEGADGGEEIEGTRGGAWGVGRLGGLGVSGALVEELDWGSGRVNVSQHMI